MDLQTRKLNLISYLTQLQDETVINGIERLVSKIKSKKTQSDIEPFTVDEFISRIQKSEDDFKNGRYKTQEELEKLSENW